MRALLPTFNTGSRQREIFCAARSRQKLLSKSRPCRLKLPKPWSVFSIAMKTESVLRCFQIPSSWPRVRLCAICKTRTGCLSEAARQSPDLMLVKSLLSFMLTGCRARGFLRPMSGARNFPNLRQTRFWPSVFRRLTQSLRFARERGRVLTKLPEQSAATAA